MIHSGKPEPHEVVVPGPVRRAISERLPEDVAWAVIEFINGPLAENPHRVGTELRGHLKAFTRRTWATSAFST